jgi:hypothetical protein
VATDPLGWAATAWLDGLLREAGLAEEAWLGAGRLPGVVGTVTAATVGAVLASRRPAHPVGWLLLGLGLSDCLAGVGSGYSRYALVGQPGALPAAAYLAWVQNAMVLILLSCVGFVLLLTPTGRLPSPRWRWWARVAAAAAALGVLAVVADPRPLYPGAPGGRQPLGRPGGGRPVPALPGGHPAWLGGGGPGRCWGGSVGRRALSGCSCAGWPWQQRCRQRHCC